MWIYPENWVAPSENPYEPTEVQRLAIKDRMKLYINTQNKPVLASKLVDIAEAYIWTNYSVHVSRAMLKDIAIEIQNEWHPPPPPEE